MLQDNNQQESKRVMLVSHLSRRRRERCALTSRVQTSVGYYPVTCIYILTIFLNEGQVGNFISQIDKLKCYSSDKYKCYNSDQYKCYSSDKYKYYSILKNATSRAQRGWWCFSNRKQYSILKNATSSAAGRVFQIENSNFTAVK